MLGAQCLLLASKFSEVSRLYPAEIVYQVKEWGENEYHIFKGGAIEEYILNLLDFDVMFLTPSEFIQHFTYMMDHGMPTSCCSKVKLPRNIRDSFEKAKFYAL